MGYALRHGAFVLIHTHKQTRAAVQRGAGFLVSSQGWFEMPHKLTLHASVSVAQNISFLQQTHADDEQTE